MLPQVFICYSSKDKTYLDAFRRYLKPWEDERRFAIWRDGERILPSDRWDDKIQQALSEINIALILLSPDALASDYVRETELPLLVKRREEGHIVLTWLHLSSCNAGHEINAVSLELANGSTRRVNLLEYQGLHRADHIIDTLPDHERGRLYADAALNLADIARRHRGSRKKLRRRPDQGGRELTIQLHMQGAYLERVAE